jgi:ATP-dependent helicase YprA (DUF1998 family)
VQRAPSQAFEHVKESVVQYLETAYKVSHPAVFAERAERLRVRGTVAQAPFIEATPAFPATHKLAEIERANPGVIPAGLAELVQHGVSVDRFPLYNHQEEALLRAFSDAPHLLVATGTSSGKTETFLLPALADILREAASWSPPAGPPRRGAYDEATKQWLGERRHETRQAAMRTIVLYPMNALVNDQLARLRRILAGGDSPDWQRSNLKHNVIHFGMYTGLSRPAGPTSSETKRAEIETFLHKVEAEWQRLPQKHRETGNWPRPDSPEMLCRWDMQAAPPDILVTNYSMLEYMLLRPIEAHMFDLTKQWLETTPGARLTLVLDEAHTYTGAKGTEVAHLIRRLKERLGIGPGSEKFRAIATSASIPNVPGADDDLRRFTAGLFGEPGDRFSFIRVPGGSGRTAGARTPSDTTMRAFASFHERFSAQDPFPALEGIAQDLDLGTVDRTADPQVAAFRLFENNQDIAWVRDRTARNATLLDALATECWPELGTDAEREAATAGVLAAGSYARASATGDTPPLLSMRVHAFFRGTAGLWACMRPDCPEVAESHAHGGAAPRPVGKLYTEARPWCSDSCGSRVLELFSCRRCGLLFMGGIPEPQQHSLWPWTDDLSGDRQDFGRYEVFCVERPYPESEAPAGEDGRDVREAARSTRTTVEVHSQESYARPTWEVTPARDHGGTDSPYPQQCPRCQNWRAPGHFGTGREIIEPLRTRGPRSFSAVVEDGFRVQPRTADGKAPNFGRKALLFTDSRLDAAILAADLRNDHAQDLFRQLVMRALHACSTCGGAGETEVAGPVVFGQAEEPSLAPCTACGGTGRTYGPTPLSYGDVRGRVVDYQLSHGINPTQDVVADYFQRHDDGNQSSISDAELAFALGMRRELSEDAFALEPLGLAEWRASATVKGAAQALTEDETLLLIQAAAKILATEDVLLPPPPRKPWDWPEELVAPHERRTLYWGEAVRDRFVPYTFSTRRKLGRYIHAVARALVRAGRLPDKSAAGAWIASLRRPLWDAMIRTNILEEAGGPIGEGQRPYGIRIDCFRLHPIGDTVHRCTACGFVMAQVLLGVCRRCGQESVAVSPNTIRSFYRRHALFAVPGTGYDDPFPLRAIEHTAQIPGAEARDIERWFQDRFRDDDHALDKRVDVLSVTTTMEMGIDIGNLLSVGLRNVPPTVANYQQRAGRAGRRGSAVATVLTYAQQRSHDQHYFQNPPEIVSRPPRVPTLYLGNAVIAQRHVRSVVLQRFFARAGAGGAGSVQAVPGSSAGVFGAWGTAETFKHAKLDRVLATFAKSNRDELVATCTRVVDPTLVAKLPGWIDAVPDEVAEAVHPARPSTDLLKVLIDAGLLPKYAFPIDVVSLSIPPGLTDGARAQETETDTDLMQRDLKIALAEYAPGAEVVRGTFPNTYIYRSAAIYDPRTGQPNYASTGVFLQCEACQAVALFDVGTPAPAVCQECGDPTVTPYPCLRPSGFSVDAALPNAGRTRYEGGGRERSGHVSPARLLVGQSSFASPAPHWAPDLHALVHTGDLFSCNMGPDRNNPGYDVCPACGRWIQPEDRERGWHRRPSDVPPHEGSYKGPRAGDRCPNPVRDSSPHNNVILGHRFHSEVLLLGPDLPLTLDAPADTPAGRALWYSFGTLVATAAARELQLDPGELKVGIRPARRPDERLHAEVFIYDDVPGGAGYARTINANLEPVLDRALTTGRTCPNPDCTASCYRCILDYSNQYLHPLLDRELGTAMLDFLLNGVHPTVDSARAKMTIGAVERYAFPRWTVHPGFEDGSTTIACVLEDGAGQRVGIWPIHPLAARPSNAERLTLLERHGIRAADFTVFDLERRPYWVVNHLADALA